MAMLFLGVLVVAAGYIGVRQFFIAERPEATVDVVEFQSFEAQLKNSDAEQLVDLYLETKEAPSAALPIRIAILKKKDRIAKRLVKIGKDNLRDFGAAACFENLAKQNSLLMMHGILTPSTTGHETALKYLDELSEVDGLVRLNSDSDDNVHKSREIAVLLGEYFNAYFNNKPVNDAIVELYDDMASKCQSSEKLFPILFDIGMHAFKQQSTDTLLKSFIKHFESTTPKGSELVVFASKQISNKNFSLRGKNFYDAKSNNVVDAAFDEVKSTISSADVDTEVSVRLQQIANFARLGEPEKGIELLNLIKPKINDATHLKRRFDSLNAQFANFGKTFSIDGVEKLDGTQAVFSQPDANLKIILAGNTRTRVDSQHMLAEAMRLRNSQRTGAQRQSNVSLSFLVHDVGGQTNGLNQLRTAANTIKTIDFWLVTDKTDGGKEFLDKMPLDNAPFFIVLGADNQPISIGADVETVQEIVSHR